MEVIKKYNYCVNTFKDGMPVQLFGHIDAESKEDAVKKLIDDGIVWSRGYEFLELYEENEYGADM